MAPDDPIVAAIQSGSRAFVTFNGEPVELGLNGAREALDVVKSNCGWTSSGAAQT